MAAKNHILVPSYFTTERLAVGFTPEKFPHVSASERDALLRAGSIEAIGESGRIWRMKPGYAVRGFSARYGEYLATLRRDDRFRALMVSEITRRPMEEPREDMADLLRGQWQARAGRKEGANAGI